KSARCGWRVSRAPRWPLQIGWPSVLAGHLVVQDQRCASARHRRVDARSAGHLCPSTLLDEVALIPGADLLQLVEACRRLLVAPEIVCADGSECFDDGFGSTLTRLGCRAPCGHPSTPGEPEDCDSDCATQCTP